MTQVTQFDRSISSDTDFHNEKDTPQVILLDSSYPTKFVKTPVDTSDQSSEKGYYDKISLESWSQAVPEDQYSPPPLSEEKQLPRHLANRLSTVPQPTLHPPPITRSLSSRHLRAPSDVPADLNSRCSTVSSESYYPSVYEREPKYPLPAVTTQSLNHRGSYKLPATPRDGFRGNISRATSKRSNTTSASTNLKEWSGRTFAR